MEPLLQAPHGSTFTTSPRIMTSTCISKTTKKLPIIRVGTPREDKERRVVKKNEVVEIEACKNKEDEILKIPKKEKLKFKSVPLKKKNLYQDSFCMPCQNSETVNDFHFLPLLDPLDSQPFRDGQEDSNFTPSGLKSTKTYVRSTEKLGLQDEQPICGLQNLITTHLLDVSRDKGRNLDFMTQRCMIHSPTRILPCPSSERDQAMEANKIPYILTGNAPLNKTSLTDRAADPVSMSNEQRVSSKFEETQAICLSTCHQDGLFPFFSPYEHVNMNISLPTFNTPSPWSFQINTPSPQHAPTCVPCLQWQSPIQTPVFSTGTETYTFELLPYIHSFEDVVEEKNPHSLLYNAHYPFSASSHDSKDQKPDQLVTSSCSNLRLLQKYQSLSPPLKVSTDSDMNGLASAIPSTECSTSSLCMSSLSSSPSTVTKYSISRESSSSMSLSLSPAMTSPNSFQFPISKTSSCQQEPQAPSDSISNYSTDNDLLILDWISLRSLHNQNGSAPDSSLFSQSSAIKEKSVKRYSTVSSNNLKKELFHPNECRPCAFFWNKGCTNGLFCKFCHEKHPDKKKKALKDQKNLMIIARSTKRLEFVRCTYDQAIQAINQIDKT